MEKKFFTWGEWDPCDTLILHFMDLTIVAPLPGIEIGTHFDNATIDYENGIMEFYNDDSEVLRQFELELVVKTKG